MHQLSRIAIPCVLGCAALLWLGDLEPGKTPEKVQEKSSANLTRPPPLMATVEVDLPSPVMSPASQPTPQEPLQVNRLAERPSQPTPVTASQSNPATTQISAAQITLGKHLLQQLELGQGPDMEIAWPAHQRDQQQLFHLLHDCAGMRVAKMDQGKLTAIEPGIARPMSGFVRLVSGQVAAQEAGFIRSLPGNGVAVRLFPRVFDAHMLGRLAAVVGEERFRHSRRIQGYYEWRGRERSVRLTRIQVDGEPVNTDILLLDAGACRTFNG